MSADGITVAALEKLAADLREEAGRFEARSRSGPVATAGGSADINAGRADGLERAALKIDALIARSSG